MINGVLFLLVSAAQAGGGYDSADDEGSLWCLAMGAVAVIVALALGGGKR